MMKKLSNSIGEKKLMDDENIVSNSRACNFRDAEEEEYEGEREREQGFLISNFVTS